MHSELYNNKDARDIERYAKKLVGKSLRDILEEENIDVKEGNKGGIGQILEKYYFKLKLNNESEPDFKEAGVELKSGPYKYIRGNKISAKERLVLNIIDYMEEYKKEFKTSSFYKKNSTILLIEYLYEKYKDRLDYIIGYVQLFQFPEKDLKIIEDDWNKIVDKIKQGKAHEISEGDTNYLGACTKGSSKDSTRKQPFNEIEAKQRAFSLKSKYMTYVINEYLDKGKNTYDDSIIKNIEELEDKTFEEIVIEKINRYKGKNLLELALEFGVNYNPEDKAATSRVANAMVKNMLGVEGKSIEEFEKANIKIKTIRLTKNGSLKESMSFPAFKFKEIVEEEWESSCIREIFLNTRYLFVIYQYDNNGSLVLKNSMFWNMPYNDLENEVKSVWEKTRNIINEGIKIIDVKVNKNGKEIMYNNLPNSKDNRVAHVRPHATKDEKKDIQPNGEEFTKQCFWLNQSYIKEQIKEIHDI